MVWIDKWKSRAEYDDRYRGIEKTFDALRNATTTTTK
jgi:hypothetical protein